MAKVQRALFNTSYYESGAAKYEKGKHYPVTEETKTRALAGDAEIVEVEMQRDAATEEQAAAQTKLGAERKATSDAEAAAARGGDAIPV
jgi:hypothetical protein